MEEPDSREHQRPSRNHPRPSQSSRLDSTVLRPYRTRSAELELLAPAEMPQFFRVIRDQSDQVRYLIGDLLDVARIETGTLPFAPEPSDVRLLVDEAETGS